MRSIPASDATPGEEETPRSRPASTDSVPLIAEELTPLLGSSPFTEDGHALPLDSQTDIQAAPMPRTAQVYSRLALGLGALALVVGGIAEWLLFDEITRGWGMALLLMATLVAVAAWRGVPDRPLMTVNT